MKVVISINSPVHVNGSRVMHTNEKTVITLNLLKMTIRDSNFITILAPMITKLKLKGNELLVFALIHGFSQDGESRFKGSLRYLIEWTGLDKSTVIKLLKQLVDKQYINKFEYEKNKVRYCEYTSNYWVGKSNYPPVGKSNPRGWKIRHNKDR